MKVHLNNELSRSRISRRYLEKRIRAALRYLGLKKSILSVSFVSDQQIAGLNWSFRSKWGPTDVLSFPMEPPDLLGDIVISLETARRQAAAKGCAVCEQCLFLFLHGLLHLLGYDHQTNAQWRRMEAKHSELALALSRMR